MKSAIELQDDVRSFWDGKPCNSELSQNEVGSRQFFLDIEASRYRHESHINEVLAKIDWRTKKVLEIGTGVATDARNIIARGGDYAGINLDAGSTELSNRALQLFGLPGTVLQASATDMPFADDSFDAVYCFGVLMHIPEVGKAVSEIIRVLKPGGTLLVMVYNRSSFNYHVEIMFLRKLFLRLLLIPGVINVFGALGLNRQKLSRHVELLRTNGSMSNEEWLSRNTDGPDNPYATVYGKSETEQLFKDFDILSNEAYFFDYRHWGVFGRLMPKKLVGWLGKRWGWHRVVYARKRGGPL
jgi:ubiquinone/menaquinone biosynthesis C-methylase UbiE